jgi:hypothetical protein
MVFCETSICKKRSKITDLTSPNIQFRSQVAVSVQNTFQHIADTIPRAIFIYNLLQRINMRFILAMAGIKNPWVVFVILLLI